MTVSDKINILIVEDNEDHLFFIKKVLSQDYYNLQVITNGTEAYNYLLNPKIKPDVVLLDNHLPGMNGLEILKKLGAKKNDYGFIVTTVDNEPDIIVKAMNLGALDFLPKTPKYFYMLSQKIDKIYKYHKSELENIERKNQYKTVIETTNDAVIIVNNKGEITEWNKASENMFGYSEKEVLNKPLTIIIPKNYIQAHIKKFNKVVKKGLKIPKKYIDLEAVTKKGTILFVELSLSSWQFQSQSAFCAIIRDVTLKRKIEKELFNKNQFLSKHLSQTPLATIYVDIKMIVREWNLAAKNIFGYSAKEAIGKNLFNLVVPDAIFNEIDSVRQNVLKELSGSHYQNKNKTKTGTEIICNWFNSVIKDDQNNIIGVACMAQDITGKIEISKNLEEAQTMAQIGSFTLDLITFKGICSKSFGNIINLDVTKPIDFHKDWRSIVHPDDVAGNRKRLLHCIKTGDKFDLIYRITPKGSSQIKWIHGLGKIIFKDKKATHFIGSIQDITESKRAEEALRKSEEKYRLITENISDVVWTFNISKNKFTYISPSDYKITGYTAKEAIQHSIREKFTAESAKIAEETIQIEVQKFIENPNNSDIRLYNLQQKCKNGSLIWVEISVRFRYNSDNEIELLGTTRNIDDRKEAEKEILKVKEKAEANKNLYKKLLNALPQNIYHLDKKLKFLVANKAYCNTYNLEEEKLKGKTSKDIFKDDAAETYMYSDSKIIKTGKAIEYSEKSKYLGKENRWHNIIKVPIKDNKGNVESMLGIYWDITDQKKAQEKILLQNKELSSLSQSLSQNNKLLAESELKFRTLYEKSGDAFLIIKNGVFVDCNPATVSLLKYKNKTAVLNAHPSVLSPEFQPDGRSSLEKANEQIALALKNGTNRFEWNHKKSTGEIFPVEVLLTTISNEPQNIIIHCVWRDITDRKQAEENLKQSEQLYKSVFESAPLGIFHFNNKSVITDVNKELVRIIGSTPKKIVGLNIYSDFTDNKMIEAVRSTLEKGSGYYEDNYTSVTANKTTPLVIRFKAIKDVENKIVGGVGLCEDITERKTIEKALKENEHQLQEAQQIAKLGHFVYDDATEIYTTSKILDTIVGIDSSYIKNKKGWIDLCHPEDLIAARCVFNSVTEKNASQEFRMIRFNDKKIIWVFVTAKKEFDSSTGQRSKLIGTIQDITERKLSEEKLKQSDTILNKLNSLILVNEGESNIIYVSPSVKTVLGYEPEEILGQGWWQLTFTDLKSVNNVKQTIREYLCNNSPLPIKVSIRKIKTKKGDYKWIEWYVSKGWENTVIAIGIDITEKYEKERRFKTIIDTANEVIILADHKGNIKEWNPMAMTIFGYSKEEILDKPLTKLMPPAYFGAHKKAFADLLKKGKVQNRKARIVEALTKNGQRFPIEISFNSWKEGNNLIYCAFIKDISERQRQEKVKEVIYNITKKVNENIDLSVLFNFIRRELSQLIDTTNFFIALYNKKTDLISTPYMVDEKDEFDDFPKGKSLTGYIIDSKKSLIGSRAVFNKLVNKGKISILGPCSKSWLGVPLLTDKVAIGAIVIQSYTEKNAYSQDDAALLELIASNISQAIKQKQDFEQINLLSHALTQSSEAVIITDVNGTIQYVNPAFSALSGYTEQEALGQNPSLVKSGNQHVAYYEKLWNTILSGQTWQGEFVNKRKDGTKYLVQANISPIKNINGIITHFVDVQEDITKKRKLERDLLHAFIDAQEQEKISFGEDLHDSIGQTLSAESMFLQVLAQQNKDVLDAKALKLINKVKDLNIKAINEARNIAHGLMSKQLKEDGLLKAVAHICKDYNGSKNIIFKYTHKGLKETDIAKAIKINIFRVIQEISTNTIRHSGAKKVKISLSKTQNNMLQLIYSDNGVGIDFEKMKREKKGAGLKNIERRVALLKGTYTLDSVLDKGVKYTIEVPLFNI